MLLKLFALKAFFCNVCDPWPGRTKKIDINKIAYAGIELLTRLAHCISSAVIAFFEDMVEAYSKTARPCEKLQLAPPWHDDRREYGFPQISIIDARIMIFDDPECFGNDNDLLLSVPPVTIGLWTISDLNPLTFEYETRQASELKHFLCRAALGADIQTFLGVFGFMFVERSGK